jgi:hypothetical protein
MKADDIFLESDEGKYKLFTSAIYICQLTELNIIDCAVKIPYSLKQLKEMSEEQLNNK